MRLVRGLNEAPMTREERTERMLAHVAAQEQSGTSRKSYCEQHALKLHVLNYWCAKARKSDRATGFAPVEVASSVNIELRYPNGVHLLLPAGTALEQVAACIRLY